MCATCGCSSPTHAHDHAHEPLHSHAEPTGTSRRLLALERDILAQNDRLAEHNRGWLTGRGVLGLNLMSSPGAGKTSLLERTIRDLADMLTIAVIEGDQATERDAERIRAAGARAVQINTGTMCHLDASIVRQALVELDPVPGSVVAIENVGNLVCPALFDLGEHARVVVVSVTEGDDKPLKYPHMFHAADLVVLNKLDLLPHVDFDVASCLGRARQINASLTSFEVSARSGQGLGGWYEWLLASAQGVRLRQVAAS
jgi:hydrogenase nickel incorporation protein HypB